MSLNHTRAGSPDRGEGPREDARVPSPGGVKRKGYGAIVINGPIAAFDDEEVRTILDAATQDQILVLIPIGHPFAE